MFARISLYNSVFLKPCPLTSHSRIFKIDILKTHHYIHCVDYELKYLNAIYYLVYTYEYHFNCAYDAALA